MREKLLQCSEYSDVPYSVKNEFVDLRVKAEANCRAGSKKAEVSLDEIYHMLTKMSACSEEQSCLIKKLEILLERKLSIKISENIKRILDLISKGEKVILISDMYLDRASVVDMLCDGGVPVESIPIYLSSEYGVTKSSGALYSKIREIEHIEYDEWEHVGDNEISDMAVPQMLGIKTNPYRINRYSASIPSPGGEVIDGLRQYYENTADLSDEEKVGAFYAGPILYAYVKWIIEMSRKRELTDLLFLSRDGYILQKIACIICDKMGIPINIKYVYSSRVAWRTDDQNEIEKLRNYIRQCIGNEESRFAFVDTQGTGLSLDRVCRACDLSTFGFYFCMLGNPVDDICEKYVFWDRNKHSDVIELLCRAPHGSTLGYVERNSVWEPLLADDSMNSYQIRKFDKYVEGIELFAHEMAETESAMGMNIPMRDMVGILLDRIASAKEPFIWDFLGELTHDDHNTDQVFAPRYSVSDILEHLKGGLIHSGKRLDNLKKRLEKNEISEFEDREKEYINTGIHSLNTDSIDSRCKVVVYGAGAVGKAFICKQIHNPDICVIGWTDRDYSRYRDLGWKVVPFTVTKEMPYDLYVIAVGKRSEEVRAFLIECGIDPDRIKTIEEMELLQ